VITALASVGTTSSTPVVVVLLEPVIPYQALPLASMTAPSGLRALEAKVADTGVTVVPLAV